MSGEPKQGWKMVRFGDVVRNANLVERDPETAGIDRIVGLDDLDPGNLHIRRWDTPENGTSFSRKFTLGQTLFGKRRAYQHKVAYAEFEGICSSDILTFESKDKKLLLPELLPFICQTDSFFEHALGTSAGSLSPRTSWGALSDFEFALPPIEEQKRIAEILWAADEAADKWNVCKSRLQLMSELVLRELVKPASAQRWPLRALEEIATVERGKFSYRPRNLPQFYGGPYPFAQTGDVSRASGFIRDFEYTLTEEGKKYSKSFPRGTILITIAAVIGATAITEAETWATDSVVGIVPKDGVDVSFLEYYLRTQRRFLENVAATQTAQKNINLQVLRPLQVPVPPLEQQRDLTCRLGYIQKQVAAIDDEISKCRSLMRAVASEMEDLHV